MKYISKINKDFERLPYKGYVRKRMKNEPTDSYFYLISDISKFTIRSGAFNLHDDHVRIEMTGMQ